MSSALVFLAALLLMPTPVASADPGFDLQIWADSFQPGHRVYMNVTGPVNMSFNIYVTDLSGSILIGRTTSLDATGNYSFVWAPGEEGEYNATVQFSTGLTITRRFVIEDKITSQDLGDVYRSIFAMERRVLLALDQLTTLVNVAILLSVVGMIMSTVIFNYARKHVSRADTELTKFFKGEVASALQQQLSKKPPTNP